ncbi:hypothetical protein KAX02_11165 [candidate division WOR-3 bacterium]|nr:hypothetical protein [candidate division WOR-3 bacterium]
MKVRLKKTCLTCLTKGKIRGHRGKKGEERREMSDESVGQGFLTAVRQVSLAKREKEYSISHPSLFPLRFSQTAICG